MVWKRCGKGGSLICLRIYEYQGKKKSRHALQEQLGAVIVMGSNVQNTPQLLYHICPITQLQKRRPVIVLHAIGRQPKVLETVRAASDRFLLLN